MSLEIAPLPYHLHGRCTVTRRCDSGPQGGQWRVGISHHYRRTACNFHAARLAAEHGVALPEYVGPPFDESGLPTKWEREIVLGAGLPVATVSGAEQPTLAWWRGIELGWWPANYESFCRVHIWSGRGPAKVCAFPCPMCEGHGCPSCNDTGHVVPCPPAVLHCLAQV